MMILRILLRKPSANKSLYNPVSIYITASLLASTENHNVRRLVFDKWDRTYDS